MWLFSKVMEYHRTQGYSLFCVFWVKTGSVLEHSLDGDISFSFHFWCTTLHRHALSHPLDTWSGERFEHAFYNEIIGTLPRVKGNQWPGHFSLGTWKNVQHTWDWKYESNEIDGTKISPGTLCWHIFGCKRKETTWQAVNSDFCKWLSWLSALRFTLNLALCWRFDFLRYQTQQTKCNNHSQLKI